MKMLLVAVLVMLVTAVASEPGKRVTYTVENYLTEDTFEHTITVKVPKDSSFLDVMLKAQEEDDHFKFNYTMASWGASIVCINNLCRDYSQAADQIWIYWSFLIRDKEDGDCRMPLGVSNYSPDNWPHMVMSYTDSGHGGPMPECEIITRNWP